MRTLLILAAVALFAVLAIPSLSPRASAIEFVGVPRVVDGDSLALNGASLRLYGLDAPEIGQECIGGAGAPTVGPFDCGRWAQDALAQRIGTAEVTCVQLDYDSRYDRPVVRCALDGIDMNEALVREGYAIAYRRYSTDYVAAEDAARTARRGLWATTMQTPEAFRRAPVPEAARPETVAAGCDIKGNISDNGQIYHMPGQENYDRTRINPARGERWFCSESDALAAGWRRARR